MGRQKTLGSSWFPFGIEFHLKETLEYMIVPGTLIWSQLHGYTGSPLWSLKGLPGFIALMTLFTLRFLGLSDYGNRGIWSYRCCVWPCLPADQEEPARQHVWAPRYQPIASKMISVERNTVVWDASFRLLWRARQALVYLAFWLIFARLKRLYELLLSGWKLQGFCFLLVGMFPSPPQALSGSCVVSKKQPVLRKAPFLLIQYSNMVQVVWGVLWVW